MRRQAFANNQWNDIDKELSCWLHNERLYERTIGTLTGYVAVIRRFLTFCNEFRYNPTELPYPAKFMCYWISYQTKRLKSANSIRTWEAAVTWLGYCVRQIGNQGWRNDPEYISTRKTIVARNSTSISEKFPFTLQHLITYTKHRNVTPETYYTCEFDALVDITWLQLLFTTLSRPCELLRKPGDEDKPGMCFKDFKYHDPKGYHYFILKVRHYKNQRKRMEPKELIIANTLCGKKSCDCRLINPYHLFYILIKRRNKLAKSTHLNKIQKTQLQCNRNNKIFVHFSGEEMTTKNTKAIIKHMALIVQVLEPEKYSEYSLRVGGATHCTAAGIPDALMYRCVGWDPSKLPDSAKRYQRPTLELRIQFPYFLLHGFKDAFGHQHKVMPVVGLIHDPWQHTQPTAWRQ